MTVAEEILGILVVIMLVLFKKKWYQFVENKFPEVDWDREEE